MKFSKHLILLALCSQPISGLVTPTRQHAIAKSRIPIQKTKLSSDISSEVPRGGAQGGGTATIPNEVFNLIKSIVGAGVLSLPAGMLHCSFSSPLRFIQLLFSHTVRFFFFRSCCFWKCPFCCSSFDSVDYPDGDYLCLHIWNYWYETMLLLCVL